MFHLTECCWTRGIHTGVLHLISKQTVLRVPAVCCFRFTINLNKSPSSQVCLWRLLTSLWHKPFVCTALGRNVWQVGLIPSSQLVKEEGMESGAEERRTFTEQNASFPCREPNPAPSPHPWKRTAAAATDAVFQTERCCPECPSTLTARYVPKETPVLKPLQQPCLTPAAPLHPEQTIQCLWARDPLQGTCST